MLCTITRKISKINKHKPRRESFMCKRFWNIFKCYTLLKMYISSIIYENSLMSMY